MADMTTTQPKHLPRVLHLRYKRCVRQEIEQGYGILRDLVDVYYDLAQKGHPGAMFRVSGLLEDGILFEGDQESRARAWLKKSAARGYKPAREKLLRSNIVCVTLTT